MPVALPNGAPRPTFTPSVPLIGAPGVPEPQPPPPRPLPTPTPPFVPVENETFIDSLNRLGNWASSDEGSAVVDDLIALMEAGLMPLTEAKDHLLEHFRDVVLDDLGFPSLDLFVEAMLKEMAKSGNIAPLIIDSSVSDPMTEQMAPFDLRAVGYFAFRDANDTDNHTSQVEPLQTPLGTLNAAITRGSYGGTGELRWDYYVDGDAVEALSQGEVKTESFIVSVVDQFQGRAQKQVEIVLHGTNDVPKFLEQGSDASGVVREASISGDLQDTGLLNFSDPDLRDVHTVSVIQVGNPLGSIFAEILTDTTGNGSGGTISWTYKVDADSVRYLKNGDHVQDQFLIKVFDEHGESAQKAISVDIQGSQNGLYYVQYFEHGWDQGLTVTFQQSFWTPDISGLQDLPYNFYNNFGDVTQLVEAHFDPAVGDYRAEWTVLYSYVDSPLNPLPYFSDTDWLVTP